jgi:hypothetical protein
LDRSAVHFKKEPIQDTHKRVKRMFDPHRAKMRALFFALNKLILGAVALAIVVDMVLPPDVPPPSKNQVMVSLLRFDLESMASKRQPPQRQISEEEANAFLSAALKAKQSALDEPFLPFKRALIALHERHCSVTAERSLNGLWSVYTTCGFIPELRNGRLSAKIDSGYIGRLPIHPKLAGFMGALFGDIATALDRDSKLLAKMGAIDLHEKTVTLIAPTP